MALPEEEPEDPDEEPADDEDDPGEEPDDGDSDEPADEEESVTPGGGRFSGDDGEEPDPKYVYQGSADNYLKSLDISGCELNEEFHKVRTIYFVDADPDTSSLDVKAVPCDSGARVDIAGNQNVSEDMSKTVIKVTASNGDERTYRVYVRHNEE